MTGLRIALVQMSSVASPAANLAYLETQIRAAAAGGAWLIATPENSLMMGNGREAALAASHFEVDVPALAHFAALARELGVSLLIGSIAVKVTADRLANRGYLFGPDGGIIARYDKLHMFDVDLENGESYRESSLYQAGGRAVVARLPWGGLGMTICYDLRFAYLYRALAQAGAKLITVPSAFTRPTGAAHWHILLRARAIETGCFILAPAQTGVHANGRATYGHSLVVNPWGEILADGGVEEGLVFADLTLDEVDSARRKIPALAHDRAFALTFAGEVSS